mmetsp:Transcript_359/g.1242  ORF Transcript_359/g.1242 Transcript_359/m.1242 type:complete len:213 (-) Transcript_359:323-961(-)
MREQVERVVAKGGSRPAERLARPAREDGLEVWQRRHARARFLSGGAKLAENLVELVDLGVSGEQGRSAGELGEDATGGPDVNDVEVVLCAEQELWSSVPQRDHLVGVELLVGGLRGARQPKVSQLDEAGVIDEHVLRLQVAVQDPPGVAKRQAAQYLEQAALDEGGWHAAAELGVEARLEVVVKVLEHQVDARRHRHKFTHAHNVDMVQVPE